MQADTNAGPSSSTPPSVPPPPSSASPSPTASSSSVPIGPPSRGRSPTSAELEAILHSSQQNTRTVSEQVDERCWTRSSQTNARRALGRPPVVSSLCYVNFRNRIGEMVQVPNVPGMFIAKELGPIGAQGEEKSGKAQRGKTTKEEEGVIKVPDYHWKRLEGRYIWYGRGRETISRHMDEMGGEAWKGVEAMLERCEKAKKEREEKRQDQKGVQQRQAAAMRRTMGIDDAEDYESIIDLSQLYSTSLQSVHRHFIKIYSPFFRNLQRLPETFRDGTQLNMLDTVQTKLTDGSAFALVGRLAGSTVEVLKKFDLLRRGGGGGGGVGGGGAEPAA